MRDYRRNNPAYRNRERRQRRVRRERAAEVGVTAVSPSAVKMDACMSEKAATPIETGYFRVCRVVNAGAVKMDVCAYGSLVQLIVVREDSACVPAWGRAP
jgi:hypothetical protein